MFLAVLLNEGNGTSPRMLTQPKYCIEAVWLCLGAIVVIGANWVDMAGGIGATAIDAGETANQTKYGDVFLEIGE
ncbi:MAG: hypothetical protein AAF268_14610 [Cyanobacteria bacterium P01_A01_bin.3]